jgi:hypothetical protein
MQVIFLSSAYSGYVHIWVYDAAPDTDEPAYQAGPPALRDTLARLWRAIRQPSEGQPC